MHVLANFMNASYRNFFRTNLNCKVKLGVRFVKELPISKRLSKYHIKYILTENHLKILNLKN